MGTISFETLQRRINQVGDIATLEPAVKRVAGQSIRRLALSTYQNPPFKRTGNTRRAWTDPKKIGKAAYEVENNAVTEPTKLGKRYNLIRIFEKIAKNKFVEKERKVASKQLIKEIIKEVRKVHR